MTGNMVSFFLIPMGDFWITKSIMQTRIFSKGVGKNTIKYVSYYTRLALTTWFEFSNRKLQDIKKSRIAMCGFWCVLFIKSGLAVDDFYDYIDSYKTRDKDSLVIDLVLNGMPSVKEDDLIN